MKWFYNLRISTKLLISYVLVALIAGIIGLIGITKINVMKHDATDMYEHNTNPLGTFGEVATAFQKARVNLRGMMLDENPDRMKANAASIKKLYGEIDENLAEFEKTLETEAGKQEFQALKASISQYQPVRDQMIDTALAGNKDEALSQMRGEGLSFEKKIDASIKKLFEMKVDHGKSRNERTIVTAKNATIQTVIFAIAGMALAVMLGLFMSRMITGPMKKVVNLAEAIADGDLTQHLDMDRDDETGQLARAMNGMTSRLHQLIESLAQNSAMVASAANQLTSNAVQMATGSEEVAAQVGTVATASEEMAATSTEIAANCNAAAQGSKNASDSAMHGSSVVQETVAGMGRIAEQVKESAHTIESLGNRSDQIGAIIGTIEDIADQTNLLALNAAIEAARAGEQGRGFAVVADEVRALAERTTKATKEIGDMIKAIQQETREAVASMENGVKEAEKGTMEAAKSGDALQEIIEQINAVTMQVNQIATAAEQQTATTCEISNNIQQVTDVIQETARGAQESSSAAHQLSKLAEEMQKLVEQFKLAA